MTYKYDPLDSAYMYLLGTDGFQSPHPRAEMQSAAVQKFALKHSEHLEGSR